MFFPPVLGTFQISLEVVILETYTTQDFFSLILVFALVTRLVLSLRNVGEDMWDANRTECVYVFPLN